MAKIIMYSGNYCPFCIRAKQLLSQKNIEFEEIDIDSRPGLRQEMVEKTGGYRQIPMIFINDEFIGGYQELAGLEKSGELDNKLK